MPEGPWRQWAYYTTRQVFSFFVYAYAAWCYLRSDDERYRARLGKLKAPFLIMVVLTTCVLLEDIYIILIAPMNTHVSWLPLYLSERNFSENVLLCFMAFVLVHVAYNVLSIRIKEAPVQEEVGDLDRHIDEQMPFFRETHKLSKREAEVLKLVLLGKNNQEIANEALPRRGNREGACPQHHEEVRQVEPRRAHALLLEELDSQLPRTASASIRCLPPF